MLSFFAPLRELTLVSMCLRMLLAAVCGGMIGLEREYKRRPAGFRTHILICLGACMTTMTSQYLYLHMHYYTDVSRLGAQVIAGIGFIGAGTIIVTRRKRVKGLTTAAGLWTAAIIGLSLGAGFFEGALLTTALILLAELVFAKLEYRMMDVSPEINLYMEYTDRRCLERVLQVMKERNVKVLNIEITRTTGTEKHNACALFYLRIRKQANPVELVEAIHNTEGVISIEEI